MGGPGAGPGEPGGPGGGPITPRTPDEAGYGDDTAGLSDRPAPATRFARLTHAQWANTVATLFELDDATEFTEGFRSDPTQQGFLFKNDAASLEVDEVLWGAYARSAGAVAERVTTDPAILARILPSDSGDSATRARDFIEEFGMRVHRRPLSDAEIDEYFALYEAGAGAYLGMTDFEGGVRLLIEAFLQSPNFVYRIERSNQRVGDVIPLDGYEVASRLSYMLWDTMPDEALFTAAASGDLARADVAAEHAARMLDDDRAKPVIGSFHAQLFDVERYSIIGPSPAFFPNASDALAEHAEEENRRFVESTVLDRNGGFSDLLTSTKTFVNDELAEIYGLVGSYGPEFVEADLNPAERRGFLTQVGFLASNATSVDPDPIHRGVFLAKRIICARIGVPPGDIPPLPAPMGRTNRETVEEHTERDGTVCASCHAAIINPLGFPFENYDAVGGYRTEDNGHPVNAATTPMIAGDQISVNDALDLVSQLADSPVVHECYTKHWLEYAYGRATVDVDESIIKRLGQESTDRTLTIKELIVGLVKTEAFLTRSAEELP